MLLNYFSPKYDHSAFARSSLVVFSPSEHQARITLYNFKAIHLAQIQSINQLFGDNKTSSAVDTDLIIDLFGFAAFFHILDFIQCNQCIVICHFEFCKPLMLNFSMIASLDMPISTAWSRALCSTSFFCATSCSSLIVFIHMVNTEGINTLECYNSHFDFNFKVCCGYRNLGFRLMGWMVCIGLPMPNALKTGCGAF
jgi:hypothetical protein